MKSSKVNEKEVNYTVCLQPCSIRTLGLLPLLLLYLHWYEAVLQIHRANVIISTDWRSSKKTIWTTKGLFVFCPCSSFSFLFDKTLTKTRSSSFSNVQVVCVYMSSNCLATDKENENSLRLKSINKKQEFCSIYNTSI